MTRMQRTEAARKIRRYLVNARTERGLTQAALAERLRRPQSFVAKYELGERRLDLLEFIEVASAIGEPQAFVNDVLRIWESSR